jgi:hypothetical protein
MSQYPTPQELIEMTLPAHVSALFNMADVKRRIIKFSEMTVQVQNLTKSTQQPHKPHMPKPRKVDAHWEGLGAATGVDPAEVQIILEDVMRNPNDMTLPLLRQLLLVGKLTVGESLSEHRGREAERRKTYDAQMAAYETNLARLEGPLAKLRKLTQERDAIYRDMWINIVDELHSHCVVADHKFRRLHPSMATAMRILDRNSKYVVLDRSVPDDWLIEVNWPFIYRFKAPHIDTILGLFDKTGIFGFDKPKGRNTPQVVDDNTPGTAEDPQQPADQAPLAQLPDTSTGSV